MRAPARILVTGGAGFIGSNFVERALTHFPSATLLNVDALTYAGDLRNLAGVTHDPRYRFLQADICDPGAMQKAFADLRPDVVVHFAAESHVDRSIEGGSVFVQTNVLGTQVILDAARLTDVGRFIHVSTDEVYGSVPSGASREDSPLLPSSPYSASKAASDLLALSHAHTYGLDVVVTRCTNNYGPRQHPEKLIPKGIMNALRGEPIPIYGTGMNVRDWLYVDDHCAAIELLMTKGLRGHVYNIGGDDERTNLDVVRAILRATDQDETLLSYVKDRRGHDFRYHLDASKMRALGWAPRVKFEEGLVRTIQWYRRFAT